MYFDEEIMVAEDGSEEITVEEPKQDPQETNWLKSKDSRHLCQYVHDTLSSMPTRDKWSNSPSQYQQMLGRLNSLDRNISRGLGADPEGHITQEQIQWLDDARERIYQMSDDLLDRVEGHHAARDSHIKNIRQRHKKKASDANKCGICESVLYNDEDIGLPLCLSCLSDDSRNKGMKKEATTPRIQLIMSPFERSIVGTLINATVSGGQNINEVYGKLKKKYGFDNREELGIVQLLADLGYPIIKDRVLMDDQEGNGEWIKNYHA